MESGGSKPSNGSSVTYFDEDGDTRLLLTRCDPERTYVVSSKAMSLVCPAWKSMLSRNNGFREATLVESNCAIPLPDDDPEALELLLNIAHMRFERIPKTLTFDELLFVADLTEKYGAVKILRPWLKDWLKGIEHLVEEPGHEEWLFIAWAFGEKEIFTRLSTHLVRKVFATREGQCLTTNARVLDPSSDDCLFPPGIIEKILEHRLLALDVMFNCCYSLLGECTADPSKYRCKHGDEFTGSGPEKAKACEALTLGSFLLGLRKLDLQEVGLHFERKTAKDFMGSFEMLGRCFQEIKIRNLGTTHGYRTASLDCDHSKCTSDLIRHLREIPKNAEHLLNPVDESHRSHMAQRRRELGQTVQPDLENPDKKCLNPRKRRRR